MNTLMKALYFKRLFDIILSLTGIILSSPFWVLISFFVWIQDFGPVFFQQSRVGKNGRIFKALKFRSMSVDAEKDYIPVQATENDPRVTKIGRLLRKTAMDELPQLINILKGDMSFVGPRALRPEEKEVIGNGKVLLLRNFSGYEERHRDRPGLTGLAQIYLPADAPRKDKFQYDLLYIKKKSLWLDIKLVFYSFWITFRAKWESAEKKI
ncbi:unnamed protein product [marine sediment metagenome]|uniref:Bacterial sugar transferase domain-containing protein n=1 Tax=marine sediment metagenome TaxID=412755 RepID=X0YZU7_9ZZZZ